MLDKFLSDISKIHFVVTAAFLGALASFFGLPGLILCLIAIILGIITLLYKKKHGPFTLEQRIVILLCIAFAIFFSATSIAKMRWFVSNEIMIQDHHCKANLGLIGIELSYGTKIYAYPNSLQVLLERGVLHADIIRCPIVSETTKAEYTYRGSGLDKNSPPEMILAYGYQNPGNDLSYVLFNNLSIKHLNDEQFIKAMDQDNRLRVEVGLEVIPFYNKPGSQSSE